MDKLCLLTECGNEREEVDGNSRRWNHSDSEGEDAIRKVEGGFVGQRK